MNNIKKYLIISLTLVFAFVLAACQVPTTTTAPGTTTTTTTTGTTTTGTNTTTATTTTTTTVTTELNALYVEAIKAILGEADVPEGFAETLVANGMTPMQFSTFKTAMETFMQEASASMGDPILINTALTDFMVSTNGMIPALVSAAMLFLPVQIAKDIAYAEEQIIFNQEQIDLYGDDMGYYAQDIYNLQSEIASMEGALLAIEANMDDLVDAAIIVVEYIIDIQGLMDNAWFTTIEGFMDPESPSYMSITELILVKDEVAQMFLDNLPAQTDVETLITIFYAMAESISGTTLSVVAQTMIPEFAQTALLEAEVFLTFLTYIDEPFITDVIDMMSSAAPEQVRSSETAILVLHLIDTFLTEEAALLTELETVLTLEQQTALFNDMLASIEDMMIATGAPEADIAIITEIISGLTYTLVNDAMTTLDEVVTQLFDFLVATDGELIRQIVISNSYQQGYELFDEFGQYVEWVSEYFNEVTGTVYVNYTEYANAKEVTNRLVATQVLGLTDALFSNFSTDDLKTITDLIIAVLPVDQLALQSGMTSLEIAAILGQVELLIGTTSDEVLALINSIIDYAVTHDVIDEIDAMELILVNYYVTNYGADYRTDYLVDMGHKSVTELIYAVKQLDTYYESANAIRIQTIIDNLFAALNNPVILTLMNISAQDLADQKTLIENKIAEVTAQIAIVATYYGLDVETLTEAQRLEIETLKNIFNGPEPTV